jgi:YHS domain-containing protein
MKARSGKIWMTLSVVVALLMGFLVFNGCKKSKDTPTDTTQEMQSHEGHDHAAMAKETSTEAADAIEQTTCPVMGGVINKELFTEYKGKKVYFCCKGCEEKFLANPEQYIAKLPQFKQ